MSLNIIQTYQFLKSSRYAFQLYTLPRCIRQPDEWNTTELEIYKGSDLSNIFYSIGKTFELLCDSFEFPGQVLTATDFRMPGRKKIKIPNTRDINEISATFYYPTEVPVYEFFSEWITRVSAVTSRVAYYNDIISSGVLKQYAEGPKMNPIPPEQGEEPVSLEMSEQMTIYLDGIYPLSIGSLTSNWSDDAFQKISVNFFVENITIQSESLSKNELADSSSKAPIAVAPGEIRVRPPTVNDFNMNIPRIKF